MKGSLWWLCRSTCFGQRPRPRPGPRPWWGGHAVLLLSYLLCSPRLLHPLPLVVGVPPSVTAAQICPPQSEPRGAVALRDNRSPATPAYHDSTWRAAGRLPPFRLRLAPGTEVVNSAKLRRRRLAPLNSSPCSATVGPSCHLEPLASPSCRRRALCRTAGWQARRRVRTPKFPSSRPCAHSSRHAETVAGLHAGLPPPAASGERPARRRRRGYVMPARLSLLLLSTSQALSALAALHHALVHSSIERRPLLSSPTVLRQPSTVEPRPLPHQAEPLAPAASAIHDCLPRRAELSNTMSVWACRWI